jgi:hypothetical protein
MGGWYMSAAGGKFYVFYAARGSRVAGMIMSFTSVDTTGAPAAERIGLPSFYDNKWWAAYGIDVLPDYYNSGSFFALATLALNNESKNQVWLRPRSDGLLNYEYKNIDDWAILGSSLCRYLRGIGPLATQPQINCTQ